MQLAILYTGKSNDDKEDETGRRRNQSPLRRCNFFHAAPRRPASPGRCVDRSAQAALGRGRKRRIDDSRNSSSSRQANTPLERSALNARQRPTAHRSSLGSTQESCRGIPGRADGERESRRRRTLARRLLDVRCKSPQHDALRLVVCPTVMTPVSAKCERRGLHV
jgi:hypothetical protein